MIKELKLNVNNYTSFTDLAQFKNEITTPRYNNEDNFEQMDYQARFKGKVDVLHELKLDDDDSFISDEAGHEEVFFKKG